MDSLVEALIPLAFMAAVVLSLFFSVGVLGAQMVAFGKIITTMINTTREIAKFIHMPCLKPIRPDKEKNVIK